MDPDPSSDPESLAVGSALAIPGAHRVDFASMVDFADGVPPLVLAKGASFLHGHGQLAEISKVIAAYVLMPQPDRLAAVGTWRELTELVDETFPGIDWPPTEPHEHALRRFAEQYVVPATVLGDGWVRRGVLQGRHQLNTLSRRYDALAEIDKDIKRARDNSDYRALPALHRARSDMLNAIDDASERVGLISPKRSETVRTNVNVDIAAIQKNLGALAGAAAPPPSAVVIEAKATEKKPAEDSS